MEIPVSLPPPSRQPYHAAYSLLMSTDLSAAGWGAPAGSAFIPVQVTNAPTNAVFRLH